MDTPAIRDCPAYRRLKRHVRDVAFAPIGGLPVRPLPEPPSITPQRWPMSHAEQIEAGRRLLSTKALLGRDFRAWVETHCPYSYRSVALWMARAKAA